MADSEFEEDPDRIVEYDSEENEVWPKRLTKIKKN